jgi:hypothetical protein
MIDWKSGEPVAAVVIDVLHAEGTTRTETDPGGFFSARWPSALPTDSIRLRVQPPAPYLPYESTPRAVGSSSIAGDGTDLGRLVANPFHAYVGQVRERKTGKPVPRARVTFEPHDPYTAQGDVTTASTDSYGNFVLSLDAPGGRTTLGTLTIKASGAGLSRTISDFALAPRFIDEPLRHSGVLGVGPAFGYYVLLYLRGTDREPIPTGTEVRFVQTGGVPLSPSTMIDHSQPWGAVALIAVPERAGAVTGDLTVSLPWGPEVIEGITLSTTQDDLPVCCITFEVGPRPGGQ